MDLIWLRNFADAWRAQVSRGRAPHAVILLGAPGVGKRCAAAWMAGLRLGAGPAGDLPQYPFEMPHHPDLHWLRPPEGKHILRIDPVRELVEDLRLTSYEGGGKVAVIDPANALNRHAANSLLKTLEEPPGDALLILIADRVGRLPATVFSRCQHIPIAVPSEAESLAWLDRLHPGGDWARALAVAGNAPLVALRARDSLDDTEAMGSDFAALPQRDRSPLDVAARWAKMEPDFVLEWLCRQVQSCILRAFGASGPRRAVPVADSVLQRMDRRKLFCYLDIINRLRSQPAGSFNVQLTLESLLIDWAGELADCGTRYNK